MRGLELSGTSDDSCGDCTSELVMTQHTRVVKGELMHSVYSIEACVRLSRRTSGQFSEKSRITVFRKIRHSHSHSSLGSHFSLQSQVWPKYWTFFEEYFTFFKCIFRATSEHT